MAIKSSKYSLFFVLAFALSLIACSKDNDPPPVTDYADNFVGAYGNVIRNGQAVDGTIIITRSGINEIEFYVGGDVYYAKTTSSSSFDITSGTLTGPGGTILLTGGGVLTGNAIDYVLEFSYDGITHSVLYHAVK